MKKVPVVLALVLLCALCAASAFGDCSTLTNVTEVVPLLHVGETVHFDFEFIGGTEPYHFALVAGELPPGVNLTGSGGLRGKVKEAGTGSFDAFIQVTDAAGCTLTVAYNIQVE
jgi:putative Ig domain-containing protein